MSMTARHVLVPGLVIALAVPVFAGATAGATTAATEEPAPLAAIEPLLSERHLADPVRLDTATNTWKPNAGGSVAEEWTTCNMPGILRQLAPETAGSGP